jgi:hypothetical protein
MDFRLRGNDNIGRPRVATRENILRKYERQITQRKRSNARDRQINPD